MKPGDLVKYEDLDGTTSFGYVMYLDTDYANDVYCRIRWSDGRETEDYVGSEWIEVIQ